MGDFVDQLATALLKQLDLLLDELVDVVEVENVGQVNPEVLLNHLHNLIVVLLLVELIESASDL